MSNPYQSSDAPISGGPFAAGSPSAVQIRSIGVLSCGKLMGALYAVLGLIIGGCMTLFSLAGAAFSRDGGNAGVALGMGAAAIVMVPIMYGILGFIGGIIMSFLYNVIAGMVGGIEIRTESIH